ncbi:MAG: endonuclease [Acidobacteria bacterium]|nr:endonuclease [Acidobacteriota bacterium]MBS1867789.1 endonuclease [Acidobacteriota bacterium]
MAEKNLYTAILERVFASKFRKGLREFTFEREDIYSVAKTLGLRDPKNIGDLIYSFRYRARLPESITKHAGKSEVWIIRPAGRGKYRFALVPDLPIVPNESLSLTKIPDATPGIVAKYALSDEQALLAKLRYNRLIDIFTSLTCYSLQNHLRTSVPGMGQAETDEIYIGLDKKGMQYVLPVQGKGGADKLSVVQIEQDVAVCTHKFPALVCRPVAAQFMKGGVIALLEFEQTQQGLRISTEKHYTLVPPEDVTSADLDVYKGRTD